jgi:hypothetical protein
MKTWLFRSAMICALALAGLTGCGQKPDAAAPASESSDQGNGAAPGAPHVDASASPTADPASPLYGWEKFSSADGKFSAIFPVRPTEDVKTQPGRTVHIFKSDPGSHNAYLVAYYDRQPTEDLKSAIAKIEEGMLKKFNGRVVSHEEMEVDNYPATEFEITLDDQLSSKIRLILTGQRAYELTVVFLTAQPHPDVCEAFFNSFSLQ